MTRTMVTDWTAANLPRFRDELIAAHQRTLPRHWILERAERQRRYQGMDRQQARLKLWEQMTAEDVLRWTRAAELYYVTPAMCAVVEQAAKSMPPYRLTHDDLPSTSGLLIWGEPPVVEQHTTEEISVPDTCATRGMLWSVAFDQSWGYVVIVNILADTDILLRSGAYAEYRGTAVDGLGRDLLDRMIAEMGPLSIVDSFPLVYADRPEHKVSYRDVAAVLSTWLLMGQRIAVTTTERADRPYRRQMAREGKPEPLVRSITLRRASTATVSDHDGQGPTREYHHQWIVSGHWRNARVGEGRTGRRIVWVTEHIKGPEGAPLIGGDRVGVLRR